MLPAVLRSRARAVDGGLTALLLLQCFTLFVALPLGRQSATGRIVLDICHVLFTVICIGVLTRHPVIRAGLLASLALLVAIPPMGSGLVADLHVAAGVQHTLLDLTSVAFNGGVTAVVARHVFAPGRVTVHRVRGAVLLYLNVAALFAIGYNTVAMSLPGAFVIDGVISRPEQFVSGTAAFSYFSLTTITTTGYGDIVPISPLARSLSNLEAVFGQLFPATLLARLVSLHVAHEAGGTREGDRHAE